MSSRVVTSPMKANHSNGVTSKLANVSLFGGGAGRRNREVGRHDQLLFSTACAAASRAIGTRNGEHDT